MSLLPRFASLGAAALVAVVVGVVVEHFVQFRRKALNLPPLYPHWIPCEFGDDPSYQYS